LTPFDEAVRYTSVRDRWETLGGFARIAYNWLERTAAAVEFSSLNAAKVAHIDLDARRDLFESSAFLNQIATLIEREPCASAPSLPHDRNAGWKRALEERPLANAWRELFALPELIDFASSLNYNCSEEALSNAARRYQRPPGIGPWLRHRTRYWQVRRSLVKSLRRRSWLPPAKAVPGGVPPRSTWSALAEVVGLGRSRVGERGEPKIISPPDKNG
jgi:hypothetical protein